MNNEITPEDYEWAMTESIEQESDRPKEKPYEIRYCL